MLYRSMLALTLFLVAAPVSAEDYGPLTQDRSTITGLPCVPAPVVTKKELSDGWTNYRIEFINNCGTSYYIYIDPVPADPASPPSRIGTPLPAWESASLTCYFNPRYPARTCKGFGELTIERRPN